MIVVIIFASVIFISLLVFIVKYISNKQKKTINTDNSD